MTKTKTIEFERKANKQLLSKLFVYKTFVKILKKKRTVQNLPQEDFLVYLPLVKTLNKQSFKICCKVGFHSRAAR